MCLSGGQRGKWRDADQALLPCSRAARCCADPTPDQDDSASGSSRSAPTDIAVVHPEEKISPPAKLERWPCDQTLTLLIHNHMGSPFHHFGGPTDLLFPWNQRSGIADCASQSSTISLRISVCKPQATVTTCVVIRWNHLLLAILIDTGITLMPVHHCRLTDLTEEKDRKIVVRHQCTREMPGSCVSCGVLCVMESVNPLSVDSEPIRFS